MKTLFALIFLLLLISCNKKHITKIISSYGDGNKEEVHILDNINDTLNYKYEFYYKSGKLEVQGEFKNGKETGQWSWWYNNGNKQAEAFFTNGLYYKKRTHWFENGQLQKEEFIGIPCDGDCCEGKVIFYNSNGTRSQIKYNYQGRDSGIIFSYYPNGRPFQETHVIDLMVDSTVEQGPIIQYFENGRIELSGNFNNGWRDGIWTWSDSLGNIVQVDLWNNGTLKKRQNRQPL